MHALRRILKTLFIVVVAALPFVLLWQHQNISDWLRLRGYTPPARIAELTEHTQMTDEGRKLFYVHAPQLNDRTAFNVNCAGFEQTIVLGCYITHRSIYIFDVEDPRLEGVEEVTSAHEMLHAAYDRLSASEKQAVDRMTKNAFDNLNDERIKKVVASYEERDRTVVSNELHSILATEVRVLPSDLESYYQRYFTNRQAVVAFSEQYEAVFTEKLNRIRLLSEQIAAIENELRQQKIEIDKFESNLNADAEQLSRLRQQGRTEEYNAGVGPYNNLVGQYRKLITDYNAKVQKMNQMVEEHNSLAVEQKDLINAIDSHQSSL